MKNELWALEAHCATRDYEGDPFFDDTPSEDVRVTVCADCPVTWECAVYAIKHGYPGVWGGMNEDERDHLRRSNPTLDGNSRRRHANHIKKFKRTQ